MKRKFPSLISLVLVSTLYTSCVSGPGGASNTAAVSSANYVAPPESTYKKIKFQSTAFGALGGAALGSGIAVLSGASNKDVIAAGVAGGVAGGVVGHQAGKKQVANVKAASAQNTALRTSINDLKATNSQLARYNKSLKSKIPSMDAATAKANRKQLDKVIKTQKSNLSNAQNALASSNKSKDLAAQVERLTSEVASLDRTRTQLMKVEQGTRV